MSTPALWKVDLDGETRLARGSVGEGPSELLSENLTVDRLLATEGPSLSDAMRSAPVGVVDQPVRTLLSPIGDQPVWAAGVTYTRSRDARLQESREPDCYDRVYEANRPELFLKALPATARGPGEPIGIRGDSDWNVPEPELTLVIDACTHVVAYTIGNDVSSRSIEGENPLYLPQAKVYRGSCAIGPCLVAVDDAPAPAEMEIALTITRAGHEAVVERANVSQMRRVLDELCSWLFRANRFPIGALLMTGTPIVPSTDFTLEAGDQVDISITGLGVLTNRVEVVEC